MAWEVAKGILIAVAIILIGIPLIYILIVLIGSSFANLPAIAIGLVQELKAGIPKVLRRRAALKLTDKSEGWVLPFKNGQAAFVVCVFCLAVVIIVAVYLYSMSWQQ